jgi:glutamate-1-semialdehyde 2,1-aminomutase
VTEATTADTIVLEYNDRAAVREAFTAFGDQIACVITEAAAGNMGVIPPGTVDGVGFNAFLAEVCSDNGALFISDEVMTGFRVSRSGQFGRDGVIPDLMTFGKVMGGGFPAAAFGGRRDLMQHLAPVGGVYQAGTLSGNPVAVAAGLSALSLAERHDPYPKLAAVAARLEASLADAFADASIPVTINRAESMFSVFFTDRAVRNYADATAADHRRYARFFHAMLERGVYLPPSGYELWTLSTAHGEEAIERTLDAARSAARSL